MSMPADTPAAVMSLPERTTRSCGRGSAPKASRLLVTIQCVVAGWPSSTPAAARISAPEHTEVVNRVCGWALRIHSSTSASAIIVAVSADEPGIKMTSGRRVSEKAWVAPMTRTWLSVTIGPTSFHTKRRSMLGWLCRTS